MKVHPNLDMIALDGREAAFQMAILADTLNLLSSADRLGDNPETTSNAIYLLSEVADDLAVRAHVPEHAPTILEGAVVTIEAPAGGAR